MKLALIAVVATGVAACAQTDPKPADSKGASDKKVTVYSGRSEKLVKPLFDKFTQQTGIAVEARYGDTAQLASQLLEEGEKTKADVFFAQDAGALGAVTKKGMFVALPADSQNKVAQVYRAKGGEWVGVSGRSRVIVHNVDLVPAAELPKSVFELTDPKWKGKVGIAPTNGSFQAFVTALRVQHGEQKAEQFLSGLKANDVKIYPGNAQIVADVDAGKLALGLVNHYYLYQRAKELGKTADQLKARNHFLPDGDTGALVNVAGAGLLKRSTSDPDAQTLLDYLLGKDAQEYFAKETFEYPLVAGNAAPAGLPELGAIKTPALDLNDLDTLAETVTLIKKTGLAS